MSDALATRIWGHEKFHADLAALRCSSVAQMLGLPVAQVDLDSVSRLLQSAAVFACTTDSARRDAACQVATGAALLLPPEAAGLREAARFVLDRLSYFPTADRIETQTLVGELSAGVPETLWLESEFRRKDNLVHKAMTSPLTDFQASVWVRLSTGDSFALSAPTSAGKSHVLQEYVVSRLATGEAFRCAYLVPTRALVSQVSGTFRQLVRPLANAADIEIHTIPTPRAHGARRGIIWVLTQERMHYLLDKDSSPRCDLLIIDESQQMASGGRGILLQAVVDRVVFANPQAQLLLLAPATEDSSPLVRLFPVAAGPAMRTDESPVAQNIVRLDTVSGRGRTHDLSVQLRDGERWLDIGVKTADESLRDTSKWRSYAKIVAAADAHGASLVYVGKPSACETVAKELAELSTWTPQGRAVTELAEISSFLKTHVHEEYPLATMIEKGVAYHYGNMPAVVRSLVEEAFSSGWVRYLVCTSTLLMGVNLPATHLFMMTPTVGASTPLSSGQFWNLAGRAGRLAKDFQGNVFLVNPDGWQLVPDVDQRPVAKVVSAYEQVVHEDAGALAEYIRHGGSEGIEDSDRESAVVRLYLEHKQRGLTASFAGFTEPVPEEAKSELASALDFSSGSILLPDDVVQRNITLSPFRQQRLATYLDDRVRKYGTTGLLPAHPAASDGYATLKDVFEVIQETLQPSRIIGRQYVYYARLAVVWMRGTSLHEIINTHLEYQRSQGSKDRPSRAIFNLIDDIEDVLRFQYVRLTQCYLDCATWALGRHGFSSDAERLPSLPLYLEFGASNRVMLVLMGLGLTRTTARMVAERYPNVEADEDGLLRLLENRRDDLRRHLPGVCARELDRLLGR
ncbi:MAG TPA: DEAD/DEAH box helicase [Coriobacteriia bacterium]|jgi:hypothetical protein